jgi:hypothetical protein
VIEMVLAATNTGYPLLDIIWTMLVFFGFILWFWLFIVVFTDLFRRDDISGWGKAAWAVAMIVFSFIGILVYLIVEGRAMAERRGKDVAAARAAFETDVRSVAGSGSGPADEIARAKQLRDSGDITAEDYETLKRRALRLSTSGGGSASLTPRSTS